MYLKNGGVHMNETVFSILLFVLGLIIGLVVITVIARYNVVIANILLLGKNYVFWYLIRDAVFDWNYF